jgi:hypothetical protein
MMRSLRKNTEQIHVTYRSSDTDTLIARNFTLEAIQEHVRLSMDLSANERTRSRYSNTYLDVKKLIERAGEVESFQLSKEKWLNPLAAALKKHRDASWELEIQFKDSPSHTYKYELEVREHSLHFQVKPNGKQA